MYHWGVAPTFHLKYSKGVGVPTEASGYPGSLCQSLARRAVPQYQIQGARMHLPAKILIGPSYSGSTQGWGSWSLGSIPSGPKIILRVGIERYAPTAYRGVCDGQTDSQWPDNLGGCRVHVDQVSARGGSALGGRFPARLAEVSARRTSQTKGA